MTMIITMMSMTTWRRERAWRSGGRGRQERKMKRKVERHQGGQSERIEGPVMGKRTVVMEAKKITIKERKTTEKKETIKIKKTKEKAMGKRIMKISQIKRENL